MTRAQRLALGCYVSRWYPSGMKLQPEDVARWIPCDGIEHDKPCGNPAEFSTHANFGAPFLYFCPACWTTPNFSGKSARDRALEVPRCLNPKPIDLFATVSVTTVDTKFLPPHEFE